MTRPTGSGRQARRRLLRLNPNGFFRTTLCGSLAGQGSGGGVKTLSMKRDPLIEILKTEYSRKKSRNPSYSLRSFSRDLNIDASNLSKLLNYQKDLGIKLKKKLAFKVGLSPLDLEKLEGKLSRKTQDADYSSHQLEIFEVISAWQHYAVLELFKVKSFQASTKAITKSVADHLGLSPEAAKATLQRLLKVGLIKKTDGRLIASEDSSSSILNTATSKAHQDQQREILEGAIEAMTKTPIENRSQSSMTMAIDSSKLEEAKTLIKTFRRQLGRLMSDSANLDQVYQLSVSLYPVSTKSNMESK